MMKLQVIYLTLWSVTHAAYMNRMAMNRIRPTAFRPGVMLQRPWTHQRIVQAQASQRAPYIVYRNQPHRYAVKHFNQRTVYGSPWKTTRLPTSAVTSEYEFVRAASQPTQLRVHTDGGTGAIHTIPAPNLSLSEKPIVVIETEKMNSVTSEASKPIYEVTEKYPDHSVFQQIPAKIEQPIGFSKATSLTSPELQALIRNGAALQMASELGLSAIEHNQNSHHQQHFVPQQQNQQQQFVFQQQNRPQQFLPQQQNQQQFFVQQQPGIHHHIVQQQPIQQSVPHQTIVQQQPHQSIVPQQFTLQAFNSLPNPPELLQASPEGLVISPNALYQPDPAFLQKLQNQLLQRFPGVEFIPYAADMPQVEIQAQESQAQPLFLLQNEQITKQTPSSFVMNESNQKNVVQRGTQEGNIVTLVPELIVNNITENEIEVTSATEPQNVTVELVTEPQPSTTTVRYILETSTTAQNTTPIYYAQVGESVGDLIANGFYSAINDVRAAAATEQVEKTSEPTKAQENITTTTINPELKAYFVQKPETDEKNQTLQELKPLLGVPFAKTKDSVNVAYTLLRREDNEAKLTKDGQVYAGQIVEATISEDQDFNKEKANLLQKRAPIRLFAVTEKKDASGASTTNAPQKMAVVKAKIPPKSKLTFDDKTGEPVLRIYASYVDSPIQKELMTSKLSNLKHVRDVSSKQDTVESWKMATTKALEKTQGFDANRVTGFGIKLRSRSDDYMPLFDDYQE